MGLILTTRDLRLSNKDLNKLIYKPFARFNDDLILLSHAAWISCRDNRGSILGKIPIKITTQIPNNYNWLFYEDKDFPNFFHPILKFENNVVEVFNNIRKIEAPSIRIIKTYMELGRLLKEEEKGEECF